jgi:hypothetical protein
MEFAVAGHFIKKCSCGKVIAQCRCPDKNKQVIILKDGCVQCRIKKG